MALFGSKKNIVPKAGVKEPKKKKKKQNEIEDLTPMDINPAFQIYAPALDASGQTQSLIDEPPVQNLIENQQFSSFNQQTTPLTVEQPGVIDSSMNQYVVNSNVVGTSFETQNMNNQQIGDPLNNQVPVEQQVAVVPPVNNQISSSLPVNVSNIQQNNNNLTSVSNSEIRLPDVASVLSEDRGKVERPTKRYMYTIINTMGKKEKGPFEAETEEDVRNFLLSQDYQVLEVKERASTDIDIGGNGKINSSDLSFCLTQLSTYLKSGITLSDAVRILAKQATKPSLKHHFNQLVYELLKGENLSDAMEMQGAVFPKILINMVKTAEMTGDLPTILDDMAEYYTSMDQTKKQMKSAMTYPAVVLTIAFGVLIFMLTYLVPQFTSMFEEQGAELPALTRTIVSLSGFIKTQWYYLFGCIILVVGVFTVCYIKIQKFRSFVQIFLMHIPVVKNVIIYNEMANFAKTFASLLNHSVFITDSMEILSKVTNNEVYKGIINETLEHLSKGDSISASFKGKWAIPIVAYEMIVTGESTGQLGAMMEKVAAHFQMLHKNVIDQMKSLVEPIMICFLAVIVGVILISIIQPMFSIYSQIK